MDAVAASTLEPNHEFTSVPLEIIRHLKLDQKNGPRIAGGSGTEKSSARNGTCGAEASLARDVD
jgi:hypothetical protein